MKTRVLFAIAAGVLMLSSGAQAETYFVRNRPFNQVVQTGGETQVATEAFLRALKLNWSVAGNVVTITDQPAANPTLSAGTSTFRYRDSETSLELSPRGGSVYAALKPLATLTGYTVKVNQASGTVDIALARFATDEEKKLLGAAETAREEERKKLAESWTKKVEELKNKPENGENKAQPQAGPEKTDNEKAVDDVTARLKKLETPPPKVARLETFQADATPNPAQGTVEMKCIVRNIGDAPANPASGRLVLKGPDNSSNASNTLAAGPKKVAPIAKVIPAEKDPKDKEQADNSGVKTRVYLQKSLFGPALKPGEQWEFVEIYAYPGGNSMPIGTFTVDFTLNNTK